MAYTTIDDPSAHFKVQLYTGNATDDTAISFNDTDTTMQPDFIWIKNRSASGDHSLVDVTRGVTKYFTTSGNDEEQTYTNSVKSFDSDGFTLGTRAIANGSGNNLVAWCWKTQGGAGSSNTAGSINTTTTSVNTTSKFSISTYTGTGSAATIGHGMSSVPHWILCKERGAAGDWAMYHHKNTSAPETDVLEFNNTAATADNNGMWNDTAPTSTLITLGGSAVLNNSSDTYVCYAWSEVQGFSKFGSYTGNGNADGTFVYTGFRPAFIIFKKSSGSGDDWSMYDYKRTGYNSAGNEELRPNTTAAEQDVDRIDILSNGFKARTSSGETNESGSSYVYMAFAEAPFVNSEGVPCNAR